MMSNETATPLPDDGKSDDHQPLQRQLGVFGATMMGLGSIVGTGVFVSIGIGAGVAGPAVVAAIVLAALLAMCNAQSSAQLAANHPVSGGTYEYGYRYLSPLLGFTAGWMFLLAKSASAATAALGFAGYALHAARLNTDHMWGGGLVPLALMAITGVTLIVLSGIRRANWANVLIVGVTLFSLTVFVIGGAEQAVRLGGQNMTPFFAGAEQSSGLALQNLLQTSALMFVAFTGYGRIATLGEEVKRPRTTIPKAIVTTLCVSATLYIAVSLVAVAVLGASELTNATRSLAAPLEVVAERFEWSGVRWIVSIGAVTAMLGVLLNLVLGLSRVLFAMGRRGDMPAATSRVSQGQSTPWVAVIAIGGLIGGLTLIGDVRATWSFSAFTVLIYYSITNLAALKLNRSDRLYHPVFSWAGLAGCLGLSFFIEPSIWLVGISLLLAGCLWQRIASRK